MIRAIPILVMIAAVSATGARADDRGGDERAFLTELLTQVRAELAAAHDGRAPVQVPPTPIDVLWRRERLSAVDLLAPLVALAAADLDGDGRAELIALSATSVVIFSRGGPHDLVELGRLELRLDPAPQRPRDPVGMLRIGSDAGAVIIYARSSNFDSGVALAWRDHALEEAHRFAGFPVCADVVAKLVLGRNYFAAADVSWGPGAAPALLPESFYHASCGPDMVDAQGRTLRAFAAAGIDGRLHVEVAPRCSEADRGCPSPTTYAIAHVGDAFAIADVNSDGTPEAIVSAEGAPGAPDFVTVFRLGDDTPVFRANFPAGVVGVLVADLDGDGALEVVAATRPVGATRIELWTLN